MNPHRILAGEYILALGFTSWFAIKHGYWPWPTTVVKLSLSFGVFGLVAMAAPEFAVALTGGTLLGLFLKLYSSGELTRDTLPYQGGVPVIGYVPLNWNAGDH